MKKDLAGLFGRHGRFTRRLGMCVAMIVAMATLAAGCGVKKPSEETQSESGAYQTIDTAYCALKISADCADKIRHTETVEDGVTKETFYMIHGDGERELFQICFGVMQEGDSIGWLVTDEGRLPVMVIVPAYDFNAFEEAEQQTYLTLMDQLNVLLSSIRESEQFTTKPDVATIEEPEQQEAQLAYWEVMLPITMEWEEQRVGDVYTVDFYGMIDAERIRLYTISLGDTPAESALGMYTADGEARMLGVTPYSLDSQLPDATDAQRQTYSVLMDTINTVLPVIMGSENYSPEIPE